MKKNHTPNLRQWVAFCVAFITLLLTPLAHAQSIKGTPAEIAKAFAPRIFMHPKEEWFPSSVSFFFQHVSKQGERYVTKDKLSKPSSWDWNGAFGQQPDSISVPVYAFIIDDKREGGKAFTDIAYFTFYPYNRGKKVANTFWGNHVGDWEHLTIRFSQEGNSYTPVKVSFSQHNTNEVHAWGASTLKMEGNHLIAYEAKGSHGLYSKPGNHVYKTIKIAFITIMKLADDTGHGANWDTWKNVVTVTQDDAGKLSCTGHDGKLNAENCSTWLNFDPQFRWGNAKAGACLAGECQLNTGPSGPRGKPAVSKPSRFD